MSYDMNPYYNPEKLGLEILSAVEDPSLSYEFDMFVVWKDKSGKLYYASDSGCSCPTPFEDYNKVEDLALITNETYNDFVKDLKTWNEGYPEGSTKVAETDLVEVEKDVGTALRGAV